MMIFLGAIAHGQDHQKKKLTKQEKQAQHVAFITKHLELTTEEAEKFWPVYNELTEKNRAMKKEHRKARTDKKFDEMTDAEIDELMTDAMNMKQKELDLKKEYHEKLKAVIPVRKVAKLYHAEERYKKSQRKPGKAGQPGKPGGPNGHHGPPGGNR